MRSRRRRRRRRAGRRRRLGRLARVGVERVRTSSGFERRTRRRVSRARGGTVGLGGGRRR